MEENIKLRIGTVLNDNGIDILSEDGGDLLHDLYRVIQQELDKAKEEGYEKGKDYQARLDRELYGMSFEQIKSGDFNLKTKEDEK